jgi:hypothetical protein
MFASNLLVVRFRFVIERLALPAVLLLAVACLISACASPNEVMTEQPGSSNRAAVPGERLPDEPDFTPATTGPSAGARW